MGSPPVVQVAEAPCPQAFLLYTVDKIVASLIKHVRSLLGSCGATSKFRVGPSRFISIRFKASYLTTSAKSCGSSSGGIEVKHHSRDRTLSSIVGRQNIMSVRMITCTGWNGYVITVLYLWLGR